jgi:predicted TIM-barrel fold metal-dependent hydrolase
VDFAVFHPQSISVYKDGLTALKKAKEFHQRHPNRSAPLASIDLIGMDDPLEELTRQVEEFNPHGVKLYPSYWDESGHQAFKMDDTEVAFPLFEHARDLGLDVIAVHKALPLGAVPTEPYKIDDVSEAASSFPDLNFEIVHGGLTFAEEAGVQIGFHPNVYVNLEHTAVEALLSPGSFIDTMENLLRMGGKDAIDKILWGSGTPHFHPQLLLEAFWELEYPEMSSFSGKYEITKDDKRKMLGENLAEAHGFEIDDLQNQALDDEYNQREQLADPYSTTDFEVISS